MRTCDASAKPRSSPRSGPRAPAAEVIGALFAGRGRRVPAQFQPWHATRSTGQRYDIIRADRAGGRPADRHAGGPAGAEAARRRVRRGPMPAGRRRSLPLRPRPDARRRAIACRCRIRRSSRRSHRASSCCSTTARSGSWSETAGARLRRRPRCWSAARSSDRKGVNVRRRVLPVSALTEKDRADLAFGLDAGRRLGGAVLRAAARGSRRGPARWSRAVPAAHGQAGEAGGDRAARRDHRPLGRGHGGARRSRRRDAAGAGARRSRAGSCAPAGAPASR